MNTPDPLQPSALAPASLVLNEVLERAGLEKTSAILVTGPGGLAALLWLCRHGYQHVGLLRPGAGPHEDSDLLWAPLTCDIAALEAMLRAGPHPRDGGLLVVQTPGSAGDVADGATQRAHALLRRYGYSVERCLHGHHRDLHVARRCVGGRTRLAA
jgi:hypothetical protein